MEMVPDWRVFLWVLAGVVSSAILPYALAALFPGRDTAAILGFEETAGHLFLRLWPGVKLVLFSMVLAVVVLAAAQAAGEPVDTWWAAFLIGLGVDRGVQVAIKLIKR